MKYIFCLLAITTCLIFTTACGAGDVGRPGYNSSQNETVENTIEETNTISDSAYEDNIDGLKQYLLDNEFISGEPITMSAGIIGAQAGYKYEFTHKRTGIAVELYEFNLNDLNNKAKSTIDQINNTGTFSIQNINVEATMSKNGKYMIIYRCDSSSEDMVERKNTVIDAFYNFKA